MTTPIDAFGYVCTPLAALDDAWFGVAGKWGRPPQTCLDASAPHTPEVLTDVLGYMPSDGEWAVFTYRWFVLNFPDRPLFGVEDIPVAPVDLPAPMLLLTCGVLALLALTFKWRTR